MVSVRLVNTIVEAPQGWDVDHGTGRGMAHYVAPDGHIELAYYEVLPGIMLTCIDLACSALPATNPMGAQLATINWCSMGRCEVSFGDSGSMVVGERSICLSSSQAQSFSYPTGRYQGFEYFIDFEQVDDPSWALLASLGLSEDVLRRTLMPSELGATLAPTGELAEAVAAMERELAMETPRQPWLLLQSLRLFMLLAETDLATLEVAGSYLRRSQRDMAQAVYQQLCEQVSPTANLAPLACRFGVSEASLRAYFARVYGESPASFARSRALSQAAQMLAETDRPVAEVGSACGYANPSKFSAAFKRAYGANPLEYRRRARLA